MAAKWPGGVLIHQAETCELKKYYISICTKEYEDCLFQDERTICSIL